MENNNLQPIARLKASSGVSGLCFLSNKLPRSTCSTTSVNNKVDDADVDESSSSSDVDDDESSSNNSYDVQFQCRTINNNNHNGGCMSNNAHLVNNHGYFGVDTAVLLATCHNRGPAQVWDLRHQKVVYEFGDDRPGPGLALRRISSSSSSSSSSSFSSCRVLYQTRDEEGTVTLHDLEREEGGGGVSSSKYAAAVVTIETFSQTFCAASPCVGDANLVALPSRDCSFATIRDWRISPSEHPIAYIHGAGGTMMDNGGGDGIQKHGMLTSLALLRGQTSDEMSSKDDDHVVHHDLLQPGWSSGTTSSRPILACGMEDGNIFFHDLGMCGKKNNSIIIPHHSSKIGQHHNVNGTTLYPAETSNLSNAVISLSPSSHSTAGGTSDPILTLDLAESTTPSKHDDDKKTFFVAVAGLAGHAADLCDVPTEEQGRVAIIKGSSSSQQYGGTSKISLRLRARVGPNYYQNMGNDNDDNGGNSSSSIRQETGISAAGPGFAGISECRWRPDGRIFAAGGWDKRVRIYDRAMTSTVSPAVSNNSSSTSNTRMLLAVLKGHEASVAALDWAPDAKRSGLLATGATDGSVYIWSCFGTSHRSL